MIALPNGDLATGGLTGGIYRITSAGAVTSLRSGFEQVRGLAYDPSGNRMFAIEHRDIADGAAPAHLPARLATMSLR